MVDACELRWDATTGQPVVVVHELAAPQRGEVLLGHTAVGLEPAPVRGTRAAVGRVLAVGEGVEAALLGRRVAYVDHAPVTASSHRLVPAWRCVVVPDELDEVAVAAQLLPGLAAEMLCRRVFKVVDGHRVLVRGAAGAVGSALAAWSRQLGALVLGVVRTEASAEIAWRHGCHQVVVASPASTTEAAPEPVLAAVLATTQQRGVDVVFDGVGGEAAPRLLACLRRRGSWVAFGTSAGAPPPLSWSQLHSGSYAWSAPRLHDYGTTRDELQRAARSVFGAMRAGVLRPRLAAEVSLRDAAGIARAANGTTPGRVVLTI